MGRVPGGPDEGGDAVKKKITVTDVLFLVVFLANLGVVVWGVWNLTR